MRIAVIVCTLGTIELVFVLYSILITSTLSQAKDLAMHSFIDTCSASNKSSRYKEPRKKNALSDGKLDGTENKGSLNIQKSRQKPPFKYKFLNYAGRLWYKQKKYNNAAV